MKAIAKTIVFRLALSGFIPVKVADWLIQHGGLAHE
jgi:hypothetical protein